MTEQVHRGTALVSGAGRGLGQAVARVLADSGFTVAAGTRDPSVVADGGSEGASGSVRPWRLDLRALDDFVVPEGLRVVVNNAAIRTEYQSVESTTPEMWADVFATNVFGLVELVRRCVPALRANGGGVIANVTTSALFQPRPFFGTYLAGKAAVSAVTQVLRAEVAQFGIRVIEVMPGPVQTDMLATSTMYRAPDAEADPLYKALAEQAFPASNRQGRTGATTASVAREIVAAILDPDSAPRVAPDPVAAAALERWEARPTQDTPLLA